MTGRRSPGFQADGVHPAVRSHVPTRLRSIAYWVTTSYVALSMLYGGLAEVPDVSMGLELSSIGAATVVAVLGYPLYFVYFIGVGKVLGAVAIVLPRLPRLKEWAYAGLTFNMAGAFASWLVVTVIDGVPIPAGYGSPMFHVFNALHLIVLIVLSWALRPSSRMLGTISPARIDQTAGTKEAINL